MGERIHSIDAGRAVAMAVVVAVHAEPFGGLGTAGNAVNFVVDAAGRFAVPFFFLTAGYLFARKVARTDSRRYLRRYVSRVASIYLFALSLYAPLVLAVAAGSATVDGRPVGGAVASRALEAVSPVDLLYYGVSTTQILWFLPALIVSIALVSLFERAGAVRFLLPAAFVLYAAGLFGQGYGAFVDVPLRTRDGLFFGFPYAAVGFWIGTRRPTVDERWSTPLLGGVVLCAALAVVEQYALWYVVGDASLASGVHTAEYGVATLPLSLSLFLFVLSKPDLGRGTPAPRVGRYAVGIYVMHPLVLFSLQGLAGALAARGIAVEGSILWHLWLAPFVYASSLALYLAVARRGIVDPAGSHVPNLGRVRRAVGKTGGIVR